MKDLRVTARFSSPFAEYILGIDFFTGIGKTPMFVGICGTPRRKWVPGRNRVKTYGSVVRALFQRITDSEPLSAAWSL
jgi:hypothetical protein